MRVDSFSLAQSLSISSVSDILSRLDAGDVVRAQILEISGNDVLLKLMDGVTLKAAALSTVEAQQGDFVDFLVKEKLENQLLLETVKSPEKKPADSEAELKNQLLSLGLKLTDKNLDIAKQIKLYDLPLAKETFHQINDMILKFKDLTPAKAAFLEASGIVPDGDKVSSLNSFIGGKAQISADLDGLLKMLDSIESKPVLQKVAQALGLNERAVEVSKQAYPAAETAKGVIDGFVGKLNGFPALKNIFQNPATQEKLLDFFKANSFDASSQPEKVKEFAALVMGNFDALPIKEKNAVMDFMRELPVKLKTGLEMADKEQGEPEPDMGKIKNAIHRELGKFFADIASDKLDQEINAKNIYKELYSKLEALKESIVVSNLPGGYDIQNKIESVQNNIRFMNEMNNYSTYVQIPLTVQGQSTTGDLYILKRDARRKRLDPENVTLLISLNTFHIGQVDSLISVSRKNISLNMRVEDSVLFEMIREGHKDLYNRLSEKGYKLVDLKYKVVEEPANVVNIKEIAASELNVSKKSFDYRV